MKKYTSIIVILIFGLGVLFTACGEKKSVEEKTDKSKENIEATKEVSDDKIVDVKEAVEKENKELIDESGEFDVDKLENMIEDEKK